MRASDYGDIYEKLYRLGMQPEEIVDAVFHGETELPVWEYFLRLDKLLDEKEAGC